MEDGGWRIEDRGSKSDDGGSRKKHSFLLGYLIASILDPPSSILHSRSSIIRAGEVRSTVRRRRLKTAFLMLGFGLACWASQVLGQGDSTGARPKVIASAQPVNSKTNSTTPAQQDRELSRKTQRDEPLLDETVPSIPHEQGAEPVVPLPDDGLYPPPRTLPKRLRLRDLPKQAPG